MTHDATFRSRKKNKISSIYHFLNYIIRVFCLCSVCSLIIEISLLPGFLNIVWLCRLAFLCALAIISLTYVCAFIRQATPLGKAQRRYTKQVNDAVRSCALPGVFYQWAANLRQNRLALLVKSNDLFQWALSFAPAHRGALMTQSKKPLKLQNNNTM